MSLPPNPHPVEVFRGARYFEAVATICDCSETPEGDIDLSIASLDSLGARRSLEVGNRAYDYYSLDAIAAAGYDDIERMPVSMKILLENLLRYEDGRTVTSDIIVAAAKWMREQHSDLEITYRPARILLQDFTGVPVIVDLAAMREAVAALGGDPQRINPQIPVDLVIDHSVTIDHFGDAGAITRNVANEFERNQERYEFLRWGANTFDNLQVVPPGTGICHQVNLEYLSRTVWSAVDQSGRRVAYPDTVVGTDSHTTMVNGLAVLGWGVGGIEAEAAMLGQPISMLLPDVIGFKLSGKLREGMTATDLVLTITQQLRAHGVVGKFVEFYGAGLVSLSLPDRATIANMAPEYGATCGFFPVDQETCEYLRFTGRDPAAVALVEAYSRAQGLWHDQNTPDPVFTQTLALDLADVEPSLAGPKRPQDRVALSDVAATTMTTINDYRGDNSTAAPTGGPAMKRNTSAVDYSIEDGDVVIAAITSCTNTSNPSVMITAGLLARNARARGLQPKPWVKTSLAPGSQVVRDYLHQSGLQDDLDALGFHIVGFGCTTCIGNSGPLLQRVADAVEEDDRIVGAVLSGNRNFEGRVHAQVRANFLASPPLVVAYSLAGSLLVDLTRDPLAFDPEGTPVTLHQIWPDSEEISATLNACLTPSMFRQRYADVSTGTPEWRRISSPDSETYAWSDSSTYIRYPTFFENMPREPAAIGDIHNAKVLVVLADSVTTDHISPAGSIPPNSPAGAYLLERQVGQSQFNSYGARRGNHEIMMRGTFANIRIRNELVPGVEGGYTLHQPSGERLSIYDAAMRYAEDAVPLVVVAGREYGTGSSRDWAAKGTALLGIKAVIAESFERIHRSNLIGMGVLPLQFEPGTTRRSIGFDGTEVCDITGISNDLHPRAKITCTIRRADGDCIHVPLDCRIDTMDELDYYRHGGILQYVIRHLLKTA